MEHKETLKIGLGTVQFGIDYGISNTTGQTPPEEVKEIIGLFKNHGGRVIDTAPAYGNAEKVLGKNNMRDFYVVTKYMPPGDAGPIREQFRQSAGLLRVRQFYGYLAHRPQDVIKNPGQWEELEKLKRDGKVQKIGASFNHPSEIARFLELGLNPDLVQIPYNYFDRRFESTIRQLHPAGCEIHARSAFLQGLFFRKPDQLPDFFDEVKTTLTHLQKWNNLPGKLLSFVVNNPFIDVVITGVENAAQLRMNLRSAGGQSPLEPLAVQPAEHIVNPSKWPKQTGK